MERVTVSPAPTTMSYDVLVEPGVLRRVPELLRQVAPADRYAIICDDNVEQPHARALARSLDDAGLRSDVLSFPAGETHKTRETWARLTDRLLDLGIGRDGAVLALGGGVTGDLAGFVAATYMRGIALVQIPTSLLAMIDASIGGKTGVDTAHGKNLVGAFHPPRAVVIDPQLLRTLPERELRGGLAETVKHAAIADVAYLDWIHDSATAILARDDAALDELIRRSVHIKVRVVNEDPFEKGARKALNFGHTIGHAVEALAEYALPHGFAVSIGMIAESEAGEEYGITRSGSSDVMRRVLGRLALPITIPKDQAPNDILDRAKLDKKARRAAIRYTLIARPGEIARGRDGEWTFALDDELVASVLERLRG